MFMAPQETNNFFEGRFLGTKKEKGKKRAKSAAPEKAYKSESHYQGKVMHEILH